MSLSITGTAPIVLQSGVAVSSVYCRTEANLLEDGIRVSAMPEYWASETAFKENKQRIYPSFPWFQTIYEYDRAVDGVDILDFANEKVKADLEAQGWTVTKTL